MLFANTMEETAVWVWTRTVGSVMETSVNVMKPDIPCVQVKPAQSD